MEICSQLRLMRSVRGLTLAEVADGTGLSVSYMSDLERGRTDPSIKTLEKIAIFYGVSLSISFVGDIPGVLQVQLSQLEALKTIVAEMIGQHPQQGQE